MPLVTMEGRATAGVEEDLDIPAILVVTGARTEVTEMPVVVVPLVGQARGWISPPYLWRYSASVQGLEDGETVSREVVGGE